MNGSWNAKRAATARRVAAFGALLLGAGALLLPQWIETLLGFDFVLELAEQRVGESLERNSVSFLSLSGIKAVMASIEGSTVGVGFHLQIGDLIQPAYDYVDFVWHAFLYALGVLGLYGLVMETGILELGFPLLGIGLLLWGASALGAGVAPARWGRRIAILGLAVAYLVPASLLLSDWVSARYLVPLERKTAEQIEASREPLQRAAERMLGLREKISILEPGKSVDAITGEAKAIAEEATRAIWDRLESFLVYVLILLVELLLLPFLSAFLLYRGLSLALRAPAS